jgi:hypothetical protein
MAKWEMMTIPKDQGGLGVIHTSLMNDCLPTKWIWKNFWCVDNVWFKIIRAKYMRDDNFFTSKSKGVSQFWKGLHKIKHMFL